MKPDEKIIGEAVRIEFDSHNGRLFLVFEIKDELRKKEIKKNWTQDIEYRIVGKNLVLEGK